MKILHVCNDYFNTGVYKNLHTRLLATNIDSFVLVPTNIKEQEHQCGENVVQIRCFTKFDRYFYLLKQKMIINAVREYIESFSPDILHGHFLFSSGYSCMKMKQEYNVPYVVAVRNTDINLFFKYMPHLRKIGLEILLNAERVIFLSSSYRDLVLDKYIPVNLKYSINKKVVILPNGIDDFWHQNKSEKKSKFDNKQIHFVTVGVINRNKNQLTVAKAAEELIKKGYKITYTVIGLIQDEKVYNALIQYDFVKYIENQSKEDLIHYYRQADILVMPSIKETFGLVYAEALSQGLPVIYTKGQGFDNQFPDGEVGFAVRSNDIEEIANRVIAILQNYHDMSDNCIKDSLRFNWDDIVEKYVHIYRDLLERY